MKNLSIENVALGRMELHPLESPPVPGPTQIVVATQYSGITNGTERGRMTADFGPGGYPVRTGYQHVGAVQAAGSKVSGFHVGDTVFYGQFVGHNGWNVIDVAHADGADYTSHNCILLPRDVAPLHCALLGVAGVGMRGARRCRVSPGHNVWAAGAGPVGLFAAQAAKALGARVTVSDINPLRLAAASAVGIHTVLNATDGDFWDRLATLGPFDRILDTSGIDSLLMDIGRRGLIRHGSAIGLIGCRGETRFPWGMMHLTEASIEVSAHFSLDDLRLVLHFLQQGAIQVQPLLTHVVPVEQAVDIYNLLRDHSEQMLGVVLDWTR